ncbi:MAG: Cna B-type domain-containing protein [Lachnospiraceae bacterium]|nr:Cna B-type domain-containing protein [Lachnospiraceae bacterium]
MRITVRDFIGKLTMIVILIAMVIAIAYRPRTAEAAGSGELTVSKTVDSPISGDASITYTFNVTIYNDAGYTEKATDINGTYGDMIFSEGEATVRLGTENSATATGLPDNLYYSVSAQSTNYFTITKTGESGALSAGGEAEFTFKRQTGNLKITNTVSSIYASDMTREFAIQLQLQYGTDLNGTFDGVEFTSGIATVRLVAGESVTLTGLPAGATFMVSETGISSSDYNTTGLGTYFISTGETKTAAVTNTRIPPVTRYRGEIQWSDRNNQDGIRPASVDIQLYADGVANGNPVTLNESNSWYYIWENLPKLTNDEQPIVYSVDEVSIPAGYTKSVSGYFITNTHTVEETEATVKAVWMDNNDEAGLRPAELTVKLISDGADTGRSVTLNGTNDWGAKIENLNKNKNGLPIAYTWDMTGLPDGYQLTDTSVSGTTTTFTNTLSTGGFKAGLTVASSDASDLDREFSFTASLKTEENGTAVSGIFGGKQFENGEYSFTMKSGDEIEFSEIPSGVYYSVKQTNLSGFNVYSSDRTGTVTTNTTSAVAFLFTKNTGGLFSVTNNVVSRLPSDSNLAFSYTLTLNDTSINCTYQDMEFTDGVTSFSLKGGETKVAEGLPEGTGYTIKESEESGFTQKFQIVHGDTTTNSAWSSNGYSGTITDSSIVARFTNTRKVGDLEVSNELISDLEADKDVLFTFTVTLGEPDINGTFGDMEFLNSVATVKLKGGESATAIGLPVGLKYKVTETSVEGFIRTGEISEFSDGQMISTNPSVVMITNTRETGDLELTNTVDSHYSGDFNLEFNFTITLSDTGINGAYGGMVFVYGVATLALKDGQTATATGLPTGITYSIEEAATPGFEIYYSSGISGPISTAKSEAVFGNGRKEGGFQVENTVNSNTVSDRQKSFQFVVTLRNGENGEPVSGTFEGKTFDASGQHSFELSNDVGIYVFSGIPEGFYYEVEEQQPEGFTTTWTGRSGTVVAGANPRISFTNTREEGDLKIVHHSIVNGVSSDDSKRFTIRVSLSDTSIDNSYSAEASDGSSGFQTFTNGVADVELKPSESITIKGLPAGVDYTVTEELSSEDAALFTATITGGGGRISTSTAQTVEVTNTRNTGELIIIKNVTVNGENTTGTLADGSYTFIVKGKDGTVTDSIEKSVIITITNGANKTATVSGLPYGDYTVTEDTTGFAAKSISLATPNGIDVTLDGATPVNVSFTNDKTVGSLKITKNVTVNGAPVTAANKTLADGTYYFEVKDEDGHTVATPMIPITNGESNSAVVANLPYGTYFVNEDGSMLPPGMNLKSANDVMAMVDSNVPEVSFTNDVETTSVNVQILWDDEADIDGKRPHSAVVYLYGNAMEMASAVLDESMNWTYRWEDLPKYDGGGLITYTVSGMPIDAYMMTVTGDAASGFVITNSYTPMRLEARVNMEFAADQDLEVTMRLDLLRSIDGTQPVTVDSKTETVQTSTGWRGSFMDLPKYEYGREYTYTIDVTPMTTERAGQTRQVVYHVDQNTTVLSTNEIGYDIIVTQLTDVRAQTDWQGNAPTDGPTVSATLKNGGTSVGSATLTEANNWTATIPDVAKYADVGSARNNQPIDYALSVGTVIGYDMVVSGDATAGFTVTGTRLIGALTVRKTFTHTPAAMTTAKQDAVTFTVTSEQIAGFSPVTFTYGDMTNGRRDITGLTPGVYIVTESNADVDGYVRTTTYDASGTQSRTIQVNANGNAFMLVTNDYSEARGNLQITVSFAADATSRAVSASDAANTKITVTSPSGETTYQVGRDFTNGVLTLNDLKVGDYTITEDVNSAHVDGYTLTVTGNRQTVTLEAGRTKEVTIVNTYTGTEVWEAYVYESGEKGYSSAELDLKATASGNLALLVKKAVRNGSGKWVRYGTDGNYVRGWYTVSTPTAEEIYYFDKKTGMKVTGDVVIDGRLCHFDSSSGLYKP